MWLTDLPLWAGLALTVALFLAGFWVIALSMRRWVLRASANVPEWDRVLEFAAAAYGVLYGVTLAMIAAGAFENSRDVDQIVLQESSSVAVLYRDASGYPDPAADELRDAVRAYVAKVIESDWPQQRAGIPPEDSLAEVDAIQDVIFGYVPTTPGEEAVQSQTIAAFNQFVADRRERIAITELTLPGVLWVVVIAGAVLNGVLIGLVRVGSLRAHLIMSGLIAVYVALVTYAIASFDLPYSGTVRIGPEYFEDLLSGLLQSR